MRKPPSESSLSRKFKTPGERFDWSLGRVAVFGDVVLRSMPSTPGQNVHLVVSQIHAVAFASHVSNSSSQLVVSSSLSESVVESSCRLVESSRRVVESSRRVVLFDVLSPLLVYSSTRRITFQLVVSPFNSSCNDLVHCSWDLRDLGTTTKQSNMAAIEPVDELKECLRASVEMLLDKLNDRLHEDMDGVDYLCVQLDRI